MDDSPSAAGVLRREPPPWIEVTVASHEVLGDHMIRLTFVGDGLSAMDTPTIASSVRLLVPGSAERVGGDLVLPHWNGNEFLLPSGDRPVIRTFTPLQFDPDAGTLQLDVVRHPGGSISGWAESAMPGSAAALSGPGRGFEPDPAALRWIVLGDETALPAIGQLVGAGRGDGIPGEAAIEVHVEVTSADSRNTLPDRPRCDISYADRGAGLTPGHTLVETAAGLESLEPGTHVWAAGEAGAMQAVRKEVTGRLGVPRSSTTIRGYWKRRAGTTRT